MKHYTAEDFKNGLQTTGEGNSIYAIENNYDRVHWGHAFGVVLDGVAMVNNQILYRHDFFSIPAPFEVKAEGKVAMFIRSGWRGHKINSATMNVEKGDLKYIDGCTDTLLVCPPRKGDPCFNALYFPPNVDQTFHTHPSQRLGAVVHGEGWACVGDREIPLKEGDVWLIETNERHRFRTAQSPMVVVAYHPDSDFGPEDEDHPMINRTII